MKLVVALPARRCRSLILGFAAISVVLDRPEVVDPQSRPARPLRGRLRVHVGGEQQRLGVRRPHRQHRLVQHDARPGMLVGRFFLIVPVLAIAGSLARKQPVPATAGTFPTDTPLFVVLLVGVVLIVVGLTYFPVVALGPIVEHLDALMSTQASPRSSTRAIARAATRALDSVRKLDPRRMARNPVMFVVEVGSVAHDAPLLQGPRRRDHEGERLRRAASPPGSGSPCSSPTSPRRWPRAAARPRRRRCARRAPRPSPVGGWPDGTVEEVPELDARRRRRGRRRGRRGHPGRRRGRRGHRDRRRVGDHRRVGAGDPRVGRRPLGGHRRHARALRRDRRARHARSRARASSTG